MKSGLLIVTALFWLVNFTGCRSAFIHPMNTSQILTDIPYGPHERQRFDLYLPATQEPSPLVLFIHGGGWTTGDKTNQPADADRQRLLRQGIAVASTNYRLTPEHELPIPIEDAARALQFLRLHAGDYHLDPQRVALAGNSAGGCTALYLGCAQDLAQEASDDPVKRQSTRVSAVYASNAQTFLDPDRLSQWIGPGAIAHRMPFLAVGLDSPEALQAAPSAHERLRQYSAIDHLDAGDPPLYLSFNRPADLPAETADAGIHHPEFGHRMQAKARETGVPCWVQSRQENLQPAEFEDGIDFLIQQLAP